MFEKFDAWFLEKCEKACHWLQKNINGDWDCFWLARKFMHFFLVSAVCWFGWVMWYKYPQWKYAIPAFIIVVVFVLVSPEIYNIIRDTEKDVRTKQKDGLANHRKANIEARFYFIAEINFILLPMFSTAIAFIGWLPLMGLSFISTFYIALGGASLMLLWIPIVYFLCCDPLPPAKSKVRLLLEKLVAKTKEVFSPSPMPAPKEPLARHKIRC